MIKNISNENKNNQIEPNLTHSESKLFELHLIKQNQKFARWNDIVGQSFLLFPPPSQESQQKLHSEQTFRFDGMPYNGYGQKKDLFIFTDSHTQILEMISHLASKNKHVTELIIDF